MSKRENYVVAGEAFPTKSALQERIRKILHRYGEGQHLSDTDFIFMLEVLKRHPDYEVKNGVGIKAIYVRQNPVYTNTRNFWLIRIDDTQTDFSYLECLKETPHAKKFINACRVAVEPYTQKYKQEFFDGLYGKAYYCPYTNELLNFIGSHVDHSDPNTFQQLVEGFIKEHGIEINRVKINTGAVDNVFQDTFADKELEHLWVDYHNLHAELQIVSKKANLSLLKS